MARVFADLYSLEIELPGALRYLTRLRRDLYAAFSILRGLEPERFDTRHVSAGLVR